MDKQHVFNTAAKALLDQKVPSVKIVGERPDTTSTSCLYRGEGGAKCAIGHLIPDALYNPAFEGSAVPMDGESGNPREKALLDALFKIGYTKDDYGFLAELQNCHDSAVREESQGKTNGGEHRALGRPPKAYLGLLREHLTRLASRFNLNTGVLREPVPT